MTPRVTIFEDEDALAHGAAETLALLAQAAVAARGRALIALSGGGTPRPLYQRLTAPPYRGALAWERLHFFWGDERAVPPDDPGSNYGQFVELIGDLVHRTNLHRVRGELEPDAAATRYARELASLAEVGRSWPRFDLILLGLGGDGHTASLFPGQRNPAEETTPVLSVTGDYDDRPAQRVTLTPALFNDAAHLIFLVSGESKAEAVRAALEEEVRPIERPAQRIRPAHGRVFWFLDSAAASHISPA